MADVGVFVKLNRNLISTLSTAVNKDPAVDLSSLLLKVFQTYTAKLKRVHKSESRAPTKRLVVANTELKTSPPPAVTQALATSSAAVNIVSSLSSSVANLFDITCISSDPTIRLPDLHRVIKQGSLLHQGPTRAVLQLSSEVVVKITPIRDDNETRILNFLRLHAPSIPVPTASGHVHIGSQSFTFFSHVPGVPLDKIWSEMGPSLKQDIREQLDILVANWRDILPPPGTPLGSLSIPHICCDVRMSQHRATEELFTEHAFNDFLLSRPMPKVAPSYRQWLRSLLGESHRIVFTHGDLHPRNIMVQQDVQGRVTVTGILDWETGGWYPEHWELLKALSTRSISDTSDWWQMLPSPLGSYSHEVLADTLMDRIIA